MSQAARAAQTERLQSAGAHAAHAELASQHPLPLPLPVWERGRREILIYAQVPVLDCAQEVAMWDAFAALVVQRNRTAYYDDAMLTAHRIMDALQESGAKKGAWVEVKY